MGSEDKLHKTHTVFTSKQLTDKQRRHYYAKYPTFSYKRGDVTLVVVCHAEKTSFKEMERGYEE